MTIFDVLYLIGGLSLFLFGMSIMGQSLERSAGSKLELMLGKLTTNKFAGLFTGLAVTAVIQSSSATTVMVVGFVNSGLMTLRQAIHVIMGANVGTTVTAWILSLGGISGDNIVLKLLKPTSFTPILALVGICFYMFSKKDKKKDIGAILLGFAVLMFGMDTMTKSVAGLADVPEFGQLFVLFKNPILGVIVGAMLTALLQSSSASVGILQALAATGQVSYGAAAPIIMGQNIGTCITAILSSFGTNKNAKRAALVHLCFNVIGTAVWLAVYCLLSSLITPVADFFNGSATLSGIAVFHSVFNILCTVLLLPMSTLLERLANKIVPDAELPETNTELDTRLLATPAVAIDRSNTLTLEMANIATKALADAISCIRNYDPELAESVRAAEDMTDKYEDSLGSYLVKINTKILGATDGNKVNSLLKLIGDYERISDHAVNIVESAEEMKEKGIAFTEQGDKEINLMFSAVEEILNLSYKALCENDLDAAYHVEPLEEVVDKLKVYLRSQHINRLREGTCSIEAGFVWSDLITNLERVSDHCSNVAVSVLDIQSLNMNHHRSVKDLKADSPIYRELYKKYSEKYLSDLV